jgi:hypothetical protein
MMAMMMTSTISMMMMVVVVVRFLEMHMYITSALQKTDMKAVGLQLALELLHEKVKRQSHEQKIVHIIHKYNFMHKIEYKFSYPLLLFFYVKDNFTILSEYNKWYHVLKKYVFSLSEI